MTTVFLEESPTPIYARIARALGRELVRRGHEVLLVKPAGFNTTTFPAFLRAQGADTVYVSTAGSNVVQQRGEGQAGHFFEDFPGRLVFVHQDALLGGLTFEAALARLQAWQRVAARSFHLCIEPDSVTALLACGIGQAAWVPHASEFAPTAPLPVAECRHTASFVGHVLPWGFQPRAANASLEHLIDGLLQQRSADLGSSLHDRLQPWVERQFSAMGEPHETVLSRQAYIHWLRHQFNLRSMAFRGRVLEEAAAAGIAAAGDLTVYGGDPAYLHRVDRQATLGAGIRHQPPVYDEAAVQGVFRGTACSINITSLQFDHAVVNRFHDVFLAGGLCLTDARPGLAELTREHAEISYRNAAELADRVRHFSHPARSAQRRLLIEAVQRELLQRSGYPLLADAIERAVAAL
jgi:hypothetical protein